MLSLKATLMKRDGISAEEAEEQIREGARELQERLDADEDLIELYDSFMAKEFGLEPDYMEDLLFYLRPRFEPIEPTEENTQDCPNS